MSRTKFSLAFIVVLFTGLALLVVAVPARADYTAANPYWNGAESLLKLSGAESVDSVTGLKPEGSVFIAIPYQEYSAGDAAALREFVSLGGTLVVADDFRYGNVLLESLGLASRFSGDRLLDPLICYKDRYLPRLIRIRPHPLTAGVSALVLNHGTSLESVPQGGVLASSSSFSFLDLNDNGLKDEGEPEGPFTGLAVEKLGVGSVVILSDPGLLINCNLPLGDNLKLIDNIRAAAGGSLFLDAAHLPPSNLSLSKARLSSLFERFKTPWVTLILIAAIIMLLALLVFPVKGRQRKKG